MRELICDVQVQEEEIIPTAMAAMKKTGFQIRDEKQFRRFIELFTDLSNNTRMPGNRGFTPNEMRRFSDPSTPPAVPFGPGMQK